MSKYNQLPLAVHLPDDETFNSFYCSNQQSLIANLKSFVEADNRGAHGYYLFGNNGVGKSHLLHASCAHASKLGLSSVCLPMAELVDMPVEVLADLEQVDLICLDDLQLIADSNYWQRAIFDLYNRVIENDKKIILSGNDSAAQLGISLPDLLSRITWGMVDQVKPLNDTEKTEALILRAKLRGIDLNEETARYLINRLSRDMKSLIDSLDTLDKASIREQRKITIPFIKSVLLK
ncbi:DnaA regulatory inactivator Hda [Thalassotalea mangrovi]|uniref:DnaA regulatory inactivator Hda n=1 Tax=Thalassotalea mangrovi TaxID=2572245 RepID=A0A4V6WMJ6_9GAMM|nr:DnaA regulatory inactivator Hda [Thalassotalea mangrovi]TKB44369.1 DnaA regulatory inactivator Hda [Thalassotalea mangrovi]